MVVKALGIPRGTRPVVLTGDHEESPHREFYRIQYKTAGMRAPIYHAAKLLENDDLDDETWFRTFYLVVIGTYFFPGTSSMLPLEYLGSLGDSKLVCEYDWADQIFRHTMSGIKCFQERCRKAKKDGNTNPMWAGGCLPWIAIVYMDHLDFPVSTLSTHRINYAIPRASNISDVDFKFVVKHDKSKMTLIPHTYGVRPFRPFNATPYAIVDAILGNQTFQAPILPQAREVHYSHSGQEDTSQQHTTQTFSSPEGLPDYMKMIQEKYTSLWREDVERLTKLHDKHMTQFASEVFAAIKHNSTTLDGLSSPPGAPTPVASPPRAPTTIISSPQIEQPMFGEDGAHISDPKTTPNTQFWVEASKIADEVELSAGKSANMRDPSSSTLCHTTEESITATARTSCRDYDIECPTFDLLPPGETWTQQFAPNNQQSSDYVRNGSTPRLQEPNITSGSAHLDNHHNHADQNPSAEPAIEKQSDPKSVATTPTTHDGNHSASLALQNSMQAPYTDVSQPSKIGTHTHPAIQKTPAANSTTSKAQTPDDGQYGNSDLHNSQHPPSPKDCQPAKLGIQTRGPIQKPSATKGVSTTAPTPIAKQYGSSALQISHQPPSPNVCQQLELVIQTRGSIQKASTTKCVSTTAPTPVAKHYGSSALQISQKPPSPNVCQQSQLDACTIGTQTQDKKNRKKRAFLGINNDANQKILNKLKVTDISKDIYETYITRRCIRPPLAGEDRPPFVDFGKYHISYEDFRDALKPRGRIDTHVMELYIRHFNFITNVATTIEPTCTKFAFFQSLTKQNLTKKVASKNSWKHTKIICLNQRICSTLL